MRRFWLQSSQGKCHGQVHQVDLSGRNSRSRSFQCRAGSMLERDGDQCRKSPGHGNNADGLRLALQDIAPWYLAGIQ